jgi:hypothetical protein
MKQITPGDKLFFFERNFFTLDGLWMIETEKETNWNTALKIDLVVWKKLLRIIIRRLKRYLQLKEHNLENLVNILTFRWSIEGWDYDIIDLEKDKAEIRVNTCPYKSAMDRNPKRHDKISLICKDMCIPFYDVIIKEFNDEIKFNRTCYMGLGDNYCDFNFESKKETLDDYSFDWIKLNSKREVSLEDKLYYFEKNFRTLDGLWVIEIEKERDWETALKLDIVVWQQLYRIIFRRVKKYLKLKSNSLLDLIEIISFVWNCEGNLHEIIKKSENEIIVNIKTCPYIEAMERNPERHNRIHSICKDMCIPYFEPVVKEFNPKIKLNRDKFIGLGDKICNFYFKLE